ncbi:MAG: DHHW family protein [Acetatifactor sp.]|nr:DHHW family protein [Acetatifactor sp.]
MNLENEKLHAGMTVALLALVLLVFTAADLLKADRLFSETENRVLAQKPKLSLEGILSGSYEKEYEAYATDQFVHRDTWVMLKTRMDILLERKAIKGVYLAEDGSLIEQHLPQDYDQAMADKRVGLLRELTERYPQTLVMLAPTADNIQSYKLPPYAVSYDQKQLLSQVKEVVGEERVIDLFPILEEHREEPVYYRTDHHWTTLGAYYAYLEWARKVGYPPRSYDPKDLQTVSDTFLGTLHSRINLPMEADKIQIFPRTNNRKVKITYDFAKEDDSYYVPSYLEGKNQYGYFLDDNHAFIEIETAYAANGKELFIIKDSYANSLIPILAPHYEKIYVLDLRYYNGSLFSLMEQYVTHSRVSVLVVYNCIHFLEDFSYR